MKHVIVFNIYDHESLTCASLAQNVLKNDVLQEEFVLLDLRDRLPEANSYCWIGCGNAAEIANYYKGVFDRDALKNTMEHSVVFSHEPGDEGVVGTLHYKVAKYFSSLKGEEEICHEWRALSAWALSAAIYHTLEMGADALRAYEDLLKICYEAYTSGSASLESIVPGSHAEVKDMVDRDFKRHLNDISRYARPSSETSVVVGRKTREFFNGTLGYTLVSDTSVSLYNLLRRLSLSKRSWFHSTIGLYKEVLFTNERDPRFKIEEKVHLIELP